LDENFPCRRNFVDQVDRRARRKVLRSVAPKTAWFKATGWLDWSYANTNKNVAAGPCASKTAASDAV
jgi:hypothetical protein